MTGRLLKETQDLDSVLHILWDLEKVLKLLVKLTKEVVLCQIIKTLFYQFLLEVVFLQSDLYAKIEMLLREVEFNSEEVFLFSEIEKPHMNTIMKMM